MNGYQLTDAWFEFRFQHPEKVSHSHTELYFYLVYHWNKLSQKEKFGLPSVVTMEATGIRNYKTYSKCLKDLVEFGFIRIVQEAINQHQAVVVAWGKNTKADTEALTEALTKAQHEALPHIVELSNLVTNQLKKEPKQFIPPTYEEVEAFFLENNESLNNLPRCYHHYADHNWTNRDGKKVKDWKRTIKTNWFGKNQNVTNQFVPPAQPGTSRKVHESYLSNLEKL